MAQFNEVKAYMLYRIYQEAYDSRDQTYSALDAERFAAGEVGKRIAIKAIEALVAEGLLEGEIGSFDISARGIQYVENQLDISWSEIARLAERLKRHGSANFQLTPIGTRGAPGTEYADTPLPLRAAAETAGAGALQANAEARESPILWDISRLLEAPASDRVVTLDHNGGPYQEAIASLEKAIQEFKNDHHLDNHFGREKGALVRTLEAGRELLSDAQVRISSVVTTVVNPLKVLIARYQDAIAHGLAIVAIEKLCELAQAALGAIKTLFS